MYEGAEVVALNKSYRSTWEIIRFATRMQPGSKMEVVERHGEEPVIYAAGDEQAEMDFLRARMDAFPAGEYASMGIILKTNAAARALYDKLAREYDLRLISPESTAFENGITVTSVQMSKGLEFDEVIIPGANAEAYHTEFDRSLLYIACTRAMHRLSLTHTGDATPLIGH